MNNLKETISSPYDKGMILQYPDGTKSLERVEKIYSPTGTEKVHTVLDGETLQSISFRYFGDSGLWSYIADVNGIINPFDEVVPGLQLTIPIN